MKEKGFVFQGMATCGKVNMWVKLIENEDDFNNVVCVCVCVCKPILMLTFNCQW